MAKAPAPKQKPATPKVPAKRGPKTWMPSDADLLKVRFYAGCGSTLEDIAKALGVSTSTIDKHKSVKDAFHAGKSEALLKVGGKLFQMAMAGNITAIIFYLKTQGRGIWKEANVLEIAGPDGGPISIQQGMTAKEAAEAYRNELG